MLFNETKNKSIIQTRHARTAFQKAKGLMFACKKDFDYCLIFDMGYESKYRSSIHMMFVFFPIFLVFLDSNKKVVDSKIAKPWRFYSPKAPARYVLELPEKYENRIKEGDKLIF
ncbi:MAG: DUF192 domain-containing protein [Candidatus ainarchaeum sp.]|nr:DUF192 domain-containing protein [Candidatus ainarchaeum sp.]